MLKKMFAVVVMMIALHVASNAYAAAIKNASAEVTPVEDLMREHGVLRRIMFVYDEIALRLDHNVAIPDGAIADCAGVIKRFIEDYHEKLEEQYIFPKLEGAGVLKDLIATLRAQHDAGRAITKSVLERSDAAKLKDRAHREALAEELRSFARMYRPHAAREDTVLFPAFKVLLSPAEYDQLGDLFEARERELFGREGFEGVVKSVAEIEKKLGISDISKFTPAASR